MSIRAARARGARVFTTVSWCALALACGDSSSSTSDAATESSSESGAASSGSCDGSPPTVEVQNNTPWELAALNYAVCGAMQAETYPFPGGSLPPGESFSVPLPGPGCYVLTVTEPSGCFIDMPPSTGDLGGCESYEFVLTDLLFGCPGG